MVAKYLEPAEILAEALFGLIMVLTVTLGARLAMGEEGGARELLIAAIGCNLAWGIIDGALFVMNGMFTRGRNARIHTELKRSGESGAIAIIARELNPRLAEVTTDDERARLYGGMLAIAARTPVQRTRIERDDLYGGIACAVLVIVTAMPPVLPFMLIDDPVRALRVSNFMLVAMLFGVGYFWAVQTNANRIGSGLAMMFTGLTLVLAAMALGG
jgi:VIT1/CCC1 family predicted Fe2+/Mn2+ transporter